MRSIAKMQQEYKALLAQIQEKRAPYNKTDKVMSVDEEAECDKMLDRLDEVQREIDSELKRKEQDDRESKHLEWLSDPVVDDATKATMEGAGEVKKLDAADHQKEVSQEQYKLKLQRDGFKSWMRYGEFMGSDSAGDQEFKQLQADSNTRGGYIIAPKMVTQALIENIDDMVHIRQLATVHQLERGQSLGAPVRDNDISDPIWTNELGTGDEDDTEPFGMRELEPNPLAKRIKISNKLLDAPGMDIEQYWRSRLAYKFSTVMENAFLTGNGRNQPLGLLTNSNAGLDVDRDVASGSATDITADALYDLQYKLKQHYWSRSRFIFSREAVKRIRKLTDDDNQYLWQPGLTDGQPERILGFPFIMSEFMSDDFTMGAGKYIGIFGDFSWYWIADSLQMQTQRLVELYAEKDQVGFIARLESDGQPMLPEAFARLRLAATLTA